MCLIAIAPKGKDKYADFFIEGIQNGLKNNGDGIGYALKRAHTKVIYYNKGFTSFNDFYTDFKTLAIRPEDEVVVHLRRTSTSVVNTKNCHPFLCTMDENKIDDPGPDMTTDPVLFHNGHMAKFVNHGAGHSDTYNFVRNFMRERDILSMLKNDRDIFMQLFDDIIGSNKFAIFYPNASGELILIGDFVKDDGYIFSNEGYKASRTIITPYSVAAVASQNCRVVPIDLKEKKEDFKGVSVVINEKNYKDLILVCTKPIALNAIVENDKLFITEYPKAPTTSYRLTALNDDTDIYLSKFEIDNYFKAYPRATHMSRYSDYFRLTKLITPTKSTIRKINDRITRTLNRRDVYISDDTIVDIKIGRNMNVPSVRVDSLKMFLDDHKDFLRGSILPINFGIE